MKVIQLLKRSSIALIVTTLVFACIATTQLKQASAASTVTEISSSRIVQMIEDENAVAFIKEDKSGYIVLNTSYLYFYNRRKLTEIDGVPLKDIIRLGDNAYVSEFWSENIHGDFGKWWCDWRYDYSANVTAKGPDNVFFAYSNLYFTDEDGDRYKLTIYDSVLKWHRVKYDSNNPKIVKIEWNYW